MPNTPRTWDPGSTVTLCSVPWDASYQNVVDWQSQSVIDAYFASLVSTSIVLDDSAYMPVGAPIVVDVPYSVAYAYNYCYVSNPPQLGIEPDTVKTYYYFITECRYNNPATVTLTLQLDVWTTYKVGATFGYGFLDSGHIAMANSPALPAVNKAIALRRYCDVPEGVAVGSEMFTFYEQTVSLQTDDNDAVQPDSVLIVCTADLTKDFGTMDSPKLNTASGGFTGGIYNGCDVYVIDRSGFTAFLTAIQSFSWVAQCIVSITTIPYQVIDSFAANDVDFNGSTPTFKFQKMGAPTAHRISTNGYVSIDTIEGNGWVRNDISDIRKLWTYPYTVIEIVTWDGNSLFLKPQCLYNDDTDLFAYACVVPPFARIGIYPNYYGRESNQANVTLKYANSSGAGQIQIPVGDFLDSAVWISDFPQFSIVNNNYITYMASTANTRAYQYSSAEWTNESANISLKNTYDNALDSLANTQANTQMQLETEQSNKNIDTTLDVLGNAVGLASGVIGNTVNLNPGGIMQSVAGAALNVANTMGDLQKFANTQNLAYATLANNMQLGQGIADRNYVLSSYINQGNYKNAIQSIEAGVRDAALKPPSSVGLTGGNGFRYANGLLFNFTVRYKRISPDAQLRCAQYFRRFGYQVHRYIQVPQVLNVCAKFSYYKFSEIYITNADANETEKDAIRGIMCHGVTVWGTPADIGTTDVFANTVDQNKVRTYYL